MSTHRATIHWEQPAANFLKGQYSREHTWSFDGGAVLSASPDPGVVPAPWSNPAFIDPEEAFIASLSSCHMLTFLHVASRGGFQVASYHDEATGVTSKNEKGSIWVSAVTLHPVVSFAGPAPDPGQEAKLHHTAHENCFIANSVKTEVTVSAPTA